MTEQETITHLLCSVPMENALISKLSANRSQSDEKHNAKVDARSALALLMKSLYSTRFLPAPRKDASLSHWLEAARSRQNGDHPTANEHIRAALEEEIWLPFAYFCIGQVRPSYRIFLPRIEFMAVLAAKDALEKEGNKQLIEFAESRCDAKRYNMMQHPQCFVYWCEECQCGGSCQECVLPNVGGYLTQSVTSINHLRVRQTDEFMTDDFTQWDIRLVLNMILNFKCPNEMSGKAFLQNARFDPMPTQLKPAFQRLIGNCCYNQQMTITDVAAKLLSILNNQAHTVRLLSEDLLFRIVTFSTLLCQLSKEYSAVFMEAYSQDDMTFDLQVAYKYLLEQRINAIEKQLSPAVQYASEFDKFKTILDGYDTGGCVNVLLAPPSDFTEVPKYLAALPWSLVIDFQVDPNQLSSHGSRFEEALASGQSCSIPREILRYSCIDYNYTTRIDNSIRSCTWSEDGPMPWFQPFIYSRDGSSLPSFFDSQSGNEFEEYREKIHAMMKYLQAAAQAILKKAAPSQPINVVLPLYGSYSRPIGVQHTDKYGFCIDLLCDKFDFDFAYHAKVFIRTLMDNSDAHINLITLNEDKLPPSNYELSEAWLKSCKPDSRLHCTDSIHILRLPTCEFDLQCESMVPSLYETLMSRTTSIQSDFTPSVNQKLPSAPLKSYAAVAQSPTGTSEVIVSMPNSPAGIRTIASEDTTDAISDISSCGSSGNLWSIPKKHRRKIRHPSDDDDFKRPPIDCVTDTTSNVSSLTSVEDCNSSFAGLPMRRKCFTATTDADIYPHCEFRGKRYLRWIAVSDMGPRIVGTKGKTINEIKKRRHKEDFTSNIRILERKRIENRVVDVVEVFGTKEDVDAMLEAVDGILHQHNRDFQMLRIPANYKTPLCNRRTKK